MALDREPGELFADARAIEAAGADSLWCDAHDCDPYVLLSALAAVTWRVRLVARGVAASGGRRTCEQLARGRLVVAEEAERAGERWTPVVFPQGRKAWREARAAATAAGATGIVVPNDPRLIDLLRNPDQEDDRSDLNIAVG